MSEPTRSETQLGLADLTKRLKTVGLKIVDQHRRLRGEATYIAIGNPERFTDVVISDEFLDDLPKHEGISSAQNTKQSGTNL